MDILFYFVWTLFAASLGYILVASYCVLKFRNRLYAPLVPSPVFGSNLPGVTLYKPLHGLDYEMAENLLSFARQDYPKFQIVFGVGSISDAAVAIVHEVMAQCQGVDMELVINDQVNGENPKISNLINMEGAAKYDVLIISDSDMHVQSDYIHRVLAGFDSEQVGLVTCLYKGTPASGLVSKLGAMFISQWFTPSALIPATFSKAQYCFGATMAIKRNVLTRIGGLEALVHNLADDYILGHLVGRAGLEVNLAHVVVENIIEESGIKALILHELRWARTIRAVEPWGFASTFLTDTIPLGLVASLLAWIAGCSGFWIAAPLILALGARITLHLTTKYTFSSKRPLPLWIIPIRDLLSFFIRLLCYTGRSVNWRDAKLNIEKGGEIDTLPPSQQGKN